MPATQWGKSQTRVGVAAALATLAERGVLGQADVVKLGKGSYEVRLAAGERLLAAGYQRGTGSLDTVSDRMLLWHLRSVGFSPTQARELVRKRPDQVRTVLRRVHYLQTVKGGMSNGRQIEDWNAWIRSAIDDEWAFADPDWQHWLTARLAEGEHGAPPAAPRPLRIEAKAQGLAAMATADAAEPTAPEAPRLPEYPDDLWGRAVAAFVAERGDPRLYSSWLARTALEAETEAAIEVTAEDAFVAEWVTKKYGDSLTAHLSALAGRPMTLHVNARAGQRPR